MALHNFGASYTFGKGGSKISGLNALNMVPPYVARKVGGKAASLTWEVDDTILEVERIRRKIEPPGVQSWNRQRYTIWVIDFTRASRTSKDLLSPKDLVQCDRKFLAKLRELNKPLLQERLKPYLNDMEIDGLLARRDKIVVFFEKEIAAKGEAAVLFELPRSGQPCGVGL